jgi:hypothetical protein
MKDSFLLKTSMIIALIGIISLFLITNNIEVDDTTISNIDASSIDSKITGEVISIKSSEKVSTIRLKQESFIEVLIFDNISGLKKGDTVTVTGENKKEDGNLIIYADLIELKDDN